MGAFQFILTVVDSHPHVTATYVNLTIGALNVSLNGGASFLYDVIIQFFLTPIKTTIQEALIAAITDQVNTQLNELLASLPIYINITNGIVIDYSITSTPMLTENSVTFPSRGEFYVFGDYSPSPFTTPTLPNNKSDDTQEVQMFLSDFTANTFGYTAYNLNLLQSVVNNSQVPPDVPIKLETSYFKDLIPALYQKYPNMLMQLRNMATTYPITTFSPSGAFVADQGDVHVMVLPNEQTAVEAFVLHLNVTMSGTASLNKEGTAIVGQLKLFSMGMSLKSTNI